MWLSSALACVATACSVAGAKQEAPPVAETFHLCQQCHGEQALGNQAVNAPSIAGLPKWYVENQLKKFKAGGRGTHFDDITGMQMRPMALSLATDAEITNIADYVSQLPAHKPTPTLSGGDATKGKIYFATCTACHQADGNGNQALNAPPLTHANDWYMFNSVKKFKAGIRGSNPLDVTGATMRPMAQTLPDDQAILDVVAYIVTLQK
ncbi:MAG TPA: c-type cytochrome [Polyangiales bacterium]|nr:c-type cytochrome [Polyangiales bacterium]